MPECRACMESKRKTNLCQSCKENHVCHDCLKELYDMNDWLDVNLICGKCQKVTCPDCIILCYDCANEGEFADFCPECLPDNIVEVECEYHTWWTCGKHENNGKCGECTANENYDLRQRFVC